MEGGRQSERILTGYGLLAGRDNKAVSKCQHGFVKLLPFPFQQVRKPQDPEIIQWSPGSPEHSHFYAMSFSQNNEGSLIWIVKYIQRMKLLKFRSHHRASNLEHQQNPNTFRKKLSISLIHQTTMHKKCFLNPNSKISIWNKYMYR